MPPIFGAIGAAFSAITATAIGSFLVNAAISVGLSLLAQRLQGRPRQRPSGQQIPGRSVGEDVSQAFLLGYRATEGHLSYRNSHGTSGGQPNAFLVEVIELSDIPGVSLSGLIINDRVAEIGNVAGEYGFPLTNIALDDGTVCAWVKFYDGTQTEADPYLIDKFSNDTGYAWTASHIGTGTVYAIMTYRYDRRIFQNLPRARFILSGIPLYDPRKDSSVGGSGPHRYGQPATYEPSSNSAVQVYNLKRGIHMPTGEVYGANVDAADIPLANAVAGMNICDTLINGRPQFQTSIEIRVAEDEPADKIEQILAGSLGQISEQGGVWRTRFGPPASPVLTFTDGDISISDPQSFDPIKGLEATHNAIVATYLEPADLWEPRSTNLQRNPVWEAEDKGRLLPVEQQLGAVFNLNQARQVKDALIADHRRQRQHQLVLPPDASGLNALDDVRWTSAYNGYINEDFEVYNTLWRVKTGMMQVVLRERDPDDYDWQSSQDLPLPPNMVPQSPPAPLSVPGWTVAGISVLDDNGVARRPAIRFSWSDQQYRAGQLVRWQLRLAATQVLVVEGVTPAQDLQHTIEQAILPVTGYEARGRVVAEDRDTPWTAWFPATTPDVRLSRDDMADQLRQELDAARELIDGTVDNIGGVVGDLREALQLALGVDITTSAQQVPDVSIPRLADLESVVETWQMQLANAELLRAELADRVRDAGVYVDPNNGEVKIQGVQNLQEQFSLAQIRVDGLEAQIDILAQVADFDGDILQQFNEVSALFDAVNAEIQLRATTLQVDGLDSRLTNAEATISSQGITLGTLTADLSNVDSRLTSAETTLSAIDGVAEITSTVEAVRQFASEDRDRAAFDDAHALITGLLGQEFDREERAAARQSISAWVNEQGVAQAQATLALEAQVGQAFANIQQESTARASADQALAEQLSLLDSQFGNSIATITGNLTTLSDAQGAQATQITQLQSRVSDAENEIDATANSLSSTQTTVSTQGGQITALSGNLSSLTATVGTNTSNISNLQATRVTAAGAVAAVNQQISATYADVQALASATSFAESTVDGITEGFLWRTGAGGVLELVSVGSGTSGPTTTARIRGDYILLDGNVQVTESFQVGGSGTGERAVTTREGLRVFDANNVARIIIGKLN